MRRNANGAFAIALALAIGLAALTAATGDAATRAEEASARQPTRLWYRVSATVTLKREGDFASTFYTAHNQTTAKLRLRSRAAVLLYRQCTSLANPVFQPKVLAELSTTTKTATCAEVRRSLRNANSPGEIRRMRLVDDVRFTANGQGFVDAFERKVEVPAHSIQSLAGWTIDCPAQTLNIVRTTGLEHIGGQLLTASAARDGVTTKLVFPLRLANDAEVGSEGSPCIITATGKPYNEPSLTRGFASGSGVFGDTAQYGAVPPPASVRFQIGRRFGQSFTVSAPQKFSEPQVHGTWVTTGETKLTFTVCPGGGRNVASC